MKKGRLFYAESVEDFISNKNDLENPLSDILFLSRTEKKFIIFSNVYLKKFRDEVYEFGGREKGYQAKLYRVEDNTGNFFSLWPTKGSKIPHNKPCNDFGETLARDILIYYNRDTKDNFILNVDNHNDQSKEGLPLRVKYSG